MKSSNLCQLLLSLTSADRKTVRKFINSPAFNPNKSVARLGNFALDNLVKNFSILTKQAGYAAAFPEKTFDEKEMRYCMSDLLKVVERYLIWKETTQDPIGAELHLVRAYKKLGLEKATVRSLSRAVGMQNARAVKDTQSYELDFQMEMETYHLSFGKKRTSSHNPQSVNQAIDLAYLARKLQQSCVALSHRTVVNVEYDSGLLGLVLGYLEESPWLDEHPIIALYYYGYKAATTGEEGYFIKLKNGMLDVEGAISSKELNRFYLMAINFCIQRFNRGEGRYLGEVFELYRSGLEIGLLVENDRLDRFSFKNIASIAIRLGEFEWTEGFIEKFSAKIEFRHRRNYRDFILAKLQYAQRDLDQAQQLLQNVEYEDVFLNLDAKVLLLKINFELDETALLDSFINSFQRFLNRKKELGYHRENYTNTLLFARRLLALNPFDKSEKEMLRKEIMEVKTVGEREWLLERLG